VYISKAFIESGKAAANPSNQPITEYISSFSFMDSSLTKNPLRGAYSIKLSEEFYTTGVLTRENS
jgi:hypothetical protein